MEPQNHTPEAPHTSHKKLGIVVGIIVVFAVAFIAIFSGRKSADQTATATDQTATTSETAPAATTTATPVAGGTTASTASASMYKDGTYSAVGSYMSPGGLDHVGVSLTLANDVVTDVTVTPEPGDNTSAHYQAKFVSGYKQYVVGKDISSIHLTVVSGSSLTPKGFQDALSQIEVQAQIS